MLSIYLALIDEPSDKEKFEQLYHDYQKIMFGTAMSVLHNAALAEEAVQESFLKIAKNISAFSSGELYCYERFLCHNRTKSERPERALGLVLLFLTEKKICKPPPKGDRGGFCCIKNNRFMFQHEADFTLGG